MFTKHYKKKPEPERQRTGPNFTVAWGKRALLTGRDLEQDRAPREMEQKERLQNALISCEIRFHIVILRSMDNKACPF